MHLDDGVIQRILHDELDPAQRRAADRHLGDCAECRQRVQESEREERWLQGLLRTADHPVPAAEPRIVARHARSRTVTMWMQYAAGVAIVALAAGVAYTAPGSPVRGWVHEIREWVAGPTPPREDPRPPAPAPAPEAGIALDPGENLTIRFEATQRAGTATVLLSDGPSVVVRALNGGATFATDVDRLTIGNAGSRADYEITLPRAAPWIEIAVAGRRVLLKQGSRLVTDAPADSMGRHRLTLSPSP